MKVIYIFTLYCAILNVKFHINSDTYLLNTQQTTNYTYKMGENLFPITAM